MFGFNLKHGEPAPVFNSNPTTSTSHSPGGVPDPASLARRPRQFCSGVVGFPAGGGIGRRVPSRAGKRGDFDAQAPWPNHCRPHGGRLAEPGFGIAALAGSSVTRSTVGRNRPPRPSRSRPPHHVSATYTIAPGGDTGWRTSTGDTVVAVVKGVLTVEQEAQDCVGQDVAAGGAVVVPTGKYRLHNAGGEPVEFSGHLLQPPGGRAEPARGRRDLSAPACAGILGRGGSRRGLDGRHRATVRIGPRPAGPPGPARPVRRGPERCARPTAR